MQTRSIALLGVAMLFAALFIFFGSMSLRRRRAKSRGMPATKPLPFNIDGKTADRLSWASAILFFIFLTLWAFWRS